jgi:hypothetical protein
MNPAKLSRILLVMGVVLGIAGATTMAVDLQLNIPDWIIRVALIKLAFVGSLGLLGAGAVLRRHAKRHGTLESTELPSLGEGTVDLSVRDRQAAPAGSERQRNDQGNL